MNACPICAGSLGRKTYDSYFRCNDCGVEVLTPRMTDAATDEYYRTEYQALCPTNEAQKAQHLARATVQMNLTYPLWHGGHLLELGCSNGYLMQEFARIGYHCVGVDPHQSFEDNESMVWFPAISEVVEMPFDVIALSHTLEHFNHPREELEHLISIYARPGTQFLIDVPNAGHGRSNEIYRPHHPFAWNSASLRWLLGAVGLSVIFVAAHNNGRAGENNLLMVAEYDNSDYQR